MKKNKKGNIYYFNRKKRVVVGEKNKKKKKKKFAQGRMLAAPASSHRFSDFELVRAKRGVCNG